MDDAADGTYSRAPEFEDLISLCKSLNEKSVQYVLIGGFAVILHGSARTTKNIDLLVDPSVENIQRIKQVMSALPDNAASQIQDGDVAQYEVVRIADEYVVDLMAKACGITFSEASHDIQTMDIDGVKIPVASKKLLIRMKDTEFLRWRIEEEKKAK
jgi:hypothetical protein